MPTYSNCHFPASSLALMFTVNVICIRDFSNYDSPTRIVCVNYSEAKIEMTVAFSNKILKAISGQLISNYSKRPTTSNSDPWSAKLATVTVVLTSQSAGMTTVHTVLHKLATRNGTTYTMS